MSTTYRPTSPPSDFTPAQRLWLQSELQAIKRAWEAEKPSERLQELHAEPERLFEGLIVLADGTDWDPGSGVGVYAYIGGAWEFLGASETVTADTTDYVTQAELDKLSVIANEQLRQLTKIQILLSQISGVVINDSDLDVPTYQLRELTKIALILSVMTGTVIADSETDLANL